MSEPSAESISSPTDHLQGLLPHHLKELRASGLSDETILANGIRSVTKPEQLRAILEWEHYPSKLCPAIVFPFDPQERYCRAKPDNPRKIKGKPCKYESPKKVPSRIYIPVKAKPSIENRQVELMFTEGEKKSLKATQDGFPCIGLVGIFGWKKKKSERLLPSIEEIDLKGRKVYIAFDSDLERKPEVQDAESRLAKLLQNQGAIVRCVRLPDVVGSNGEPIKQGLDDFLVANDRQALRKLIDEAIEPPEPDAAVEIQEAKYADPAAEASVFISCAKIDELSPLRFHRGSWLWWSNGRYVDVHASEVRAKAIEFLNQNYTHVTTGVTANVIDQIRAKTLLPFGHEAPCWIGDSEGWEPRDLIVCRNGIVNLAKLGANDPEHLRPATPRFFTYSALDYDFALDAPRCDGWLRFLSQLWPVNEETRLQLSEMNAEQLAAHQLKDPGPIELLQEWFGYCLVADTSLQKILLLIGAPRSGKGTIARVLRAVIGEHNVAGPTLAGMATNFGLWPLVGKLLAIVSDARLGGRTDQAAVVERLLAISGEDALTIDRKNLEPVTVRLLSRLMILSNELPRLSDASGALANRFVILKLTKSFLGEEDHGLTDRLLTERAGILLWAIKGWMRLRQRKRLVQPACGKELRDQLDDLGSPVGAFIKDCCIVKAGHRVAVADIYAAWCKWCEQEGRREPGTQQTFGRDLTAAKPEIGRSQPKEGGSRYRAYEGISLQASLGY